MSYLSLEKLIGSYSQINAEQINFITNFYTKFNNDVIKIGNVEPLYYSGLIYAAAGLEFLDYFANKLYLCLTYSIDANVVINNSAHKHNFYDENNVKCFEISRTYISHRPTEPIFHKDDISGNLEIKNFYFSRILDDRANWLTFNGFRVTLL